jgi:c-di-GMP phosphodiesterase
MADGVGRQSRSGGNPGTIPVSDWSKRAAQSVAEGSAVAAEILAITCTLAMGQEKCSDLVLSSFVRARFCELIAPKVKRGQAELYLLGLLSLMDAILEVPIGVVIEELPLDPATKAQLVCGKTDKKTILSLVYDLMVAREAGDWERVTKVGKELDLSLVFIAASYNEAMR